MFELMEDLVALPSQGKPYDSSMKLIDGSSVRIRPFVLGDQRELAAASKSGDNFNIYKRILETMVVEPTGIDVSQFLMSDVFAILFAIRLKSFGPKIDHVLGCEECGVTSAIVHDLSNVQLLKAEEIPGYNADSIEIKLSKKVLTMHLPRLKDEKTASNLIKDMQSKNNIKDLTLDTIYMRRAVVVDAVDGNSLTPMGKFDALMGLSLEDYEVLREEMANKDAGLLLNDVKMNCPACGAENSDTVTLSVEFFRPASKARPAG